MSPSSYIQDKFDLGILRTDGSTKVGLMCVKGKQAEPLYQVYDDEYLAQQFFSGVAGYGSLPPEKEIIMRQDDWRSGFGLEMYDANDPKRYYSSIGMDMRFNGMALAGPKSTTVTKPTDPAAPTIVNADMELTTGWTGGARSADQAHGGTYSWKVSPAGSAVTATQALTFNANMQNRVFTFQCWAWGGGLIPGARIGIDDGVSITYSTYTQTSAWVQLSVAKSLDKNATKLELVLWADGTGSAYFDDATITQTAITIGTTVTFAEFNDNLYASFGTNLAKLNGTGTAFTYVHTFPVAITALEPFTDNRLYIAIGTSNAYWYMSTAEAFTESTAAVNTFQYFKTVHSATPTLWGNDAVNTIRSNTNPINGGAAWSGTTTVASSYHSITGLFTVSGALYIGKEDMMYYLDSAGAVQNDLVPELQSLTSSTSCKNSVIWQNKIYIPAGSQALLESDDAVNSWISPALFATNLGDFNGQVFAVAGDDQYLFAVLDNSTKVEILAGREETIDGSTFWVWHPINETTLTGCEAAFVSSIYQKRLWFSSTLAADSLYYVPLPTGYGNITTDANRSFQTGVTMETPWLHGNFKATTKAFPSLELVMGHTYDADIYFTVKYKKLGDTGWTTIGNYTGSATSMTQSKFIPVDASSNNPKATLFKLQFTAVTDDTTKTPILYSYHLKGILYPDQREIIACKVRCANEIILRDGTIDSGSYGTIIATLDEARTATWPVTIYDLDGTTHTVKLLPLGNVPRWSVVKREAGRKEEREYNLLMQKIALS